jgi:hypothetical protein
VAVSLTRYQQAQRRAGELTQLLSELHTLYGELHEVVTRKLQAIRQNDTSAMQSCQAREKFLTERLSERDGLRKQLTRLIAHALELPAEPAPTLSQLADALGEPAAGALRVWAVRLRERVGPLEKVQQVAKLVTQEMLRHFGHLHEAMRLAASRDAGVYDAAGQRRATAVDAVLDAVG